MSWLLYCGLVYFRNTLCGEVFVEYKRKGLFKNMKVAIMQPYFFPYIGYWQLIKCVDKFIVFDDVNYINRGWINRNKILVNGEAKNINVMLKGASQNKLINEIELFSEEDWRSKILQTIRFSYKRAPYFEKAFPVVERAIKTPEKMLIDYLINTIYEVCQYLRITTEVMVSSEIQKDISLKGQDKICDICERVGEGNHVLYINPIGGQELYSKDIFAEKQMELYFLKTSDIEYKQLSNQFVPWLSIIDIMMFNDVDTISNMLDKYTLL